MAIGPVQLLVVGFKRPDFQLVGGLIGVGAAGQEGLELGAERGQVLSDEAAGGGALRAPARQRRPAGPGGAPLGHRPARPDRLGGRVPAGVGVHQPLDLVAIGLVEAEEAAALASAEGDTI